MLFVEGEGGTKLRVVGFSAVDLGPSRDIYVRHAYANITELSYRIAKDQ
jgi:hypothetical protein